MTDWINHPLRLEGEKVLLLPMTEEHFEEIINSSQDEIIWTYMPVKGTNRERLLSILTEAITKRDTNEQYPFVVIEKATGKIIGSTRLLQLNKEHRNLEIGYTWYLPQYWSKGYNEECKLLLLTYCFEELKTIRVQLIAWDKNLRSRKAIERIGAKLEGIKRNVVIRQGDMRSTACYSIIVDEWSEVKQMLTGLLKIKYSKTR
ncbi:GNAT family protein [soil metagenome]